MMAYNLTTPREQGMNPGDNGAYNNESHVDF